MAIGKKQRARRASSIAMVLSILFAGCADDPETYVGSRPHVADAPADGEAPAPDGESKPEGQAALTWTGCGISKKAYMTQAAAAYKAKHGVEILVTGGGATRGIRATAGGVSDIGGSCRCCLPDTSDQEEGVLLTHVAWDALVFFTHRENTVKGLTLDQAKSILRGEISNWQELGGPDERIIRMFRRQTKEGKLSGVGYMTRLMVFGNPDVDFTTDALFERSSGPVEEFVERTEHSFAITGVSSARKRDVRILALDGVEATKENIASGTYQLFRPLYLVTRGEPTGATKDFLDWIVGPEGQAVLSAAGTVSLHEGRALVPLFRHWPERAGLVRNQ